MKKLKLWIGVDADGSVRAYSLKPKWCAKIGDGCFKEQHRDCDYVLFLGTLPSHAGQCWRQEIAPPPAKKRGNFPPFADRGDEAALGKHEKEPFR